MTRRLRLDLHVHTAHSYDGVDSVADTLRWARANGLDGLAVTDHNSVAGLTEAKRAADGLLVVPGVEVTTSRGHLVVLGVERAGRPRETPEATIEWAREEGGLVVVPHPFHPLRHPLGRFDGLRVDAVEVFNSRFLTGWANRRALREAERLGLPEVASSDAHRAPYVGRGVTEIEADGATVDAVLEAIRKGRTSWRGRRTPVVAYLGQVGRGNLRKMGGRGPVPKGGLL